MGQTRQRTEENTQPETQEVPARLKGERRFHAEAAAAEGKEARAPASPTVPAAQQGRSGGRQEMKPPQQDRGDTSHPLL